METPTKPVTLAEALKHSNLNQRELAHKLGTGETQVSRWVGGRRIPNKLWRPRIARALGCRVEEIAWETE